MQIAEQHPASGYGPVGQAPVIQWDDCEELYNINKLKDSDRNANSI